MNEGLNSGDLWAFEQLSIKANDEQRDAMIRALQARKHRAIAARAAARNDQRVREAGLEVRS